MKYAMQTSGQVLLFALTTAGLVSAGSPSPNNPVICGVKGYDGGEGNSYYSGNGKYSTYAACAARCAADKDCQSFGFGGKECMLFSIPLSGNFEADPGAPSTYFDKACPSPSSTSTTAASSSSSSTAASSSASSAVTSSTVVSTLTWSSLPTAAAVTTKPSSVASSSSSSTPVTTPPAGTSTSLGGTAVASSSTSTSSLAIPSGCESITRSYDVPVLQWFNSTHNLDCVSGNANYDPSAQVCVDSATNALCNGTSPTKAATCTCSALCAPDAPPAAFQPPGFGPPDNITMQIAGWANYGSCSSQNPMKPQTGIAALGLSEIGNGNVDCGVKHNYINFFGNSNPGQEQGRILFIPGATCQGHQALYEATFPLACARDAGNNATCVPTAPVTVRLTRFSTGMCSSCSGSQIQ